MDVNTSAAQAAPPFNKVLVANRGEIAVRVMRTCRALGVRTVAVHSTADAASLHVRAADEAVDLGGGPASSNYLNVESIVAAAKASGADAVHPGYGFLAENADFARAVAEAGMVFIGPSPEAIATMGEKITARGVAVAAGVPLAPGSDGPVDSAADVLAFGAEHGYPVLIKASHGGGGRGMRQVDGPDGVEEAFAAAVREATAAFGNGEVYVERYLVNARHVEVQVLADGVGHTIYIGDRDCSVQRRHQKLIEEAPAPGLTDELRAAMGEAAVRLAREVDYLGAGTVEFLVEDGRYFFLEMNTRIQVEHPVTEATSGVDIVEEQLRAAAGQSLTVVTSGGPAQGAAIEARINAENVAGGLFLPAPGVIERIVPPAIEGVRWDAGYESGDEVLPLYDSLVGKLVATAPTRAEAIERLLAALAALEVAGVPTTAPAAAAIVDSPTFREAAMTTVWLEGSGLLDTVGVEGEDAEEPLGRDEVEVGGRYYRIPYVAEGAVVATGAPAVAAEPSRASGSGNRSGGGRRRAAAGGNEVKAPMQGTIVKANVEAGSTVATGDVLFVLEAMKMENPIRATRDGVLETVNATVGDSVPAGTVLAAFGAEDQAATGVSA
jgi:acetyl-CoA/propionyl-CoA carboxylase biotin carboxyl carrier protein